MNADKAIAERNLWAARNGDLHILLRRMTDALRASDPDNPLCVEADEILCDVPQFHVPRVYGDA
jgi:hypothetical protein